MGYIAHDAVIVTASDYYEDMPDVDAFRAVMPENLRHLVVGPIKSASNGYLTWFFAPDGSKEGWDTSDEGDEWRARFVDLFGFKHGDGSSPFDVVAVRYGGDHGYEVGAILRDYSDD